MAMTAATTATKAFGATSTTGEVLEGVNLAGKRVLVTGVSAGLGVETARSLAAHGAEVVGAARDLGKAKGATEKAFGKTNGLTLIEQRLAWSARPTGGLLLWPKWEKFSFTNVTVSKYLASLV